MKVLRKTPGKIKLISNWLLWPLLLLFTLALLWQSWFLLHIIYWRTYPPTTSAFMQNRMAALQQQRQTIKLRYDWTDYPQISRHLKQAVVAAEDARFLQHQGFDYKAIEIAWKKNLQQRKWTAGGSTITQQLAKNLFLSADKTIWRKSQEVLLTLMLETFMTKQRILEIYLNVIEWGEGIFGAEAAAQHYFGISAAALTPQQAAWLASIVPNPRYYETHRTSPRLLNKTKIILSRLPAAKVP